MSDGKFITFEGGEGTGKSTQIALLAEALRGRGVLVRETREPGGTAGAEDIRRLLVGGAVERWSPWTETLLHMAARNDHLEKTIRPAMKSGSWVLCDRFHDSTVAYQGYGHGLDPDVIARLYDTIAGDFAPDLTLILDLPVEDGLARAAVRDSRGETRYERMDIEFHQRLRQGFLDIAEAAAGRCAVIDASGSVEQVSELIWSALETRLGGTV